MNCRTCLGPLIYNSGLCLKEKLISDKTIKDIICFFVPEMEYSEVIGDLVCSECVDILQLFTKFIERCTIIEELLKEDSFKALINNTEIGERINDIRKIIPLSVDKYKTVEKTADKTPGHEKTSFNSKPIRTYSRKSKSTLQTSRQEPLEVKCQTNNACSENMGKTEESSDLKNIVPDSIKPFEIGAYSGNNSDPVLVCIQNDFENSTNNEIIDISEETVSNDAIDLKETESSIENSDRQCNTAVTETDNEQQATSSSLTILEPSNTTEDVFLDTNSSGNHVNEIDFSMFNDYPDLPHNRVVSVTQTSEEIEKVVNQISNLIKLQSCQKKNTKRIIFLGTAFSRCPVCQVLFTNPQPMRYHFSTVHPDVPFPTQNNKYDVIIRKPKDSLSGCVTCSICGKYFISRKWLASHIREDHKDYYRFKCEHCGRGFKKKYLYVSHLKNYKTINSCNVRLCSVCKKIFDRKEFKAHLDTHRTLECELCKKRFIFSVNLNKHCLTHQEATAKVNIRKPIKKELCNICGKFVTGACNMKKHIWNHSATRDYLCDKCSKTFKGKLQLLRHIKRVHDDNKNFECPICHRRMKVCSKNLHMKLKHSAAYTFLCNICGKGFSREDYYKRHMTHHLISGREVGKGITRYRYIRHTERDFPCKFCDKVYNHVYHLRAHLLLSHLTYIPRIKCRYCDLTFKTSASKGLHEKRHRNLETYELTCKVCWNRFSSKERLEAHSVKHENSQRHRCSDCGEPFPSKFLLAHHKGQKHFDHKLADMRRTALLADGLKDFIEEYLQ